MICPNCGNSTEDGSLFCGNCGADLRNIGAQPNYTAQNAQMPNSNQMPNFNQMPNQIPAGMMPNQMAPAPKKPMPKWIPVLIVELALLVLCGYGFKTILERNNSPEYVAENYFVNMSNGDWDKAYDLLDISESEKNDPFTSKESFETMQKQKEHSVITNYVVNPTSASEDLDSLLNASKNKKLSQTVYIEYKAEGETENEKTYSLHQAKDKKWKIYPYMICKNFTIRVLHGASVTVNDIKLDKEYLINSNVEDYSGYGLNIVKLDEYQIPQLFSGTYSLKITMDDMEDVETTVDIHEDDVIYSKNQMTLSTETQDKLIQLTSENMKQIYYAALAGKRFQTIESLFTADDEQRSELKEDYENLMTNYNESSNKVLWIRFKNLTAKSVGDGQEISVSFDYDVHYSYKDWWDGDIVEDTYSGDESLSFYYVKEDGGWVQSNLGCYTLYY